jgi:hypothetical protein
MLGELGIAAALVRGAPGPAMYRAVAAGDALALTTAPEALHPNVTARPLDPARTLAFALLWRDAAASAPLSEFVRVAAHAIEAKSATRRPLAAVA